ncbi:hypothetical protein [Sphingomonas gilva]|nr:hypothetical protein [Sphingomonas gilva]
MRHALLLAPLSALALAACGEQPTSENTAMLPPENEMAAMPAEPILPPQDIPPSNETAETDDPFAGRWTGPEGLYAQITPAATPGAYTVEMQYTLDDRGKFTATREGDTLKLTRAGQSVTITPGDGNATGMKWLAGKQDCLVVVAGSEGYCRD